MLDARCVGEDVGELGGTFVVVVADEIEHQLIFSQLTLWTRNFVAMNVRLAPSLLAWNGDPVLSTY